MTSISKLTEGFTNEDHNYLRVLQVIRNQGQKVLYQILLWGWPPGVPIDQMDQYFLDDLPTSGKIKNNFFNATAQENIKANPKGDTYDVSLLFRCIKIACVNVAPFSDNVWKEGGDTRVEYLVTMIKDKRNDIYHDIKGIDKKEMFDKIEDLRILLQKAIRVAGMFFGRDDLEVNEIMDNIDFNINEIRDSKLAPEDITTYEKELLHEHLTELLRKKGSKELKEHISKIAKLNPFHFLDGSDFFFEVGNVFSKIEIKQGGKDSKNEDIDYKDILRLTDPDKGDTATLILLEGKAGYGKTTLNKFILADWASGGHAVQDLSSYDLVLPMMCRDSHLSKFNELLRFLMAETMKSFQNENDFVACARDLKLLVLVDGLDEMNDNSQTLLKDLLSYKKLQNMSLLCTSRPEMVKNFYKMVPPELHKVHMTVQGVPEEQRGDFVQKYHDEMIKKDKSHKSTAGLVDYINRTSSKLQSHFRSPLNLLLLTHLWSRDSDIVNNVTTATELYFHVDRLRIEKLMERLPATGTVRKDLKYDCSRFEKGLFAEALICISMSKADITEASKERLKSMCSDLSLSYHEVLYHFLIMRGCFTEAGINEAISFPHQDIRDYYGAQCIYFALLNDEYFNFIKDYVPQEKHGFRARFMKLFTWQNSVQLPPAMTDSQPFKIQRTIENILNVVRSDKSESLRGYRNVFKHLAGLLGQHMEKIPEDIAMEIVTLFSKAGLIQREEWLDILREVKCDATTSKYIADFASQTLRGHVYVNDREVGVYASLMPYAKPNKITVELTSNPQDIPRLPELLKAVGCHEGIPVNLKFHYDFLQCHKSDALFGHLKSKDGNLRCKPVVIIGHISDIAVFPSTVEELSLSVGDDDHASRLQNLVSALPTALPKLIKLNVLIKFGVSESAMPVMPNLSYPPDVTFPTVNHSQIKWICDMLATIQNDKGFLKITLNNCSLEHEEANELIKCMKMQNIKIVEELKLSSSSLANHSESLTELAKTELQCKLKF